MRFRGFVGEQLARLPQFASFGTETHRKDLIDWVCTASGFPRDDKRQLPAPEWIASFEAGKRVQALVDALVDSETTVEPGKAVRAAWKRMYPVQEIRRAAPDCEYCAGSGWEERTGVIAGVEVSGMKRCRCGGMPPGEKA
jgi:hypothetical protein